MAEAICRHLGGEKVIAASAGVAPLRAVSPEALEALSLLGIDASGLSSKHLSEVPVRDFDLVVSLDSAFPVKTVLGSGLGVRGEDWSIPDPVGEELGSYLWVAGLLAERIEDLLRREGVLEKRA